MTTPGTFPIGTKHPVAASVAAARPPQLPIYQPPSTPEEIAREKDRITLLLEINVVLLQHTTSLQAQGLGGVLGTQQQPHGEAVGEAKNPSEEYVKCMRCLSSNISYLTAAATMVRNRPGTLPGPAIMEPPDSLNALLEPYERLKGLFPGWTGLATAGTVWQRPNSIGGGIGAGQGLGIAQGQGLGLAQGQQAQGQTMGMAQGMGYPSVVGMGMGGQSNK